MINEFIRTGLVQPGYYQGETLRFRFELIASYPRLLEQVASVISNEIEQTKYDRIVATPDAIAPGVWISQKVQIPLVYRAGREGSVVHDLVGAYDVGHPTLMIADVVTSADELLTFITQCDQVGLMIKDVWCICMDTHIELPSITVRSITTVDEITRYIKSLTAQ